MKKLILLVVLVFGMNITTQAQTKEPYVYFSAGFDVKNLAVGSEPTNNESEIDALFRFGMVSPKGMEVSMGYEYFNRIGFTKEYVGIGYQIQAYENIIVIPTIEPTFIVRNWDKVFGKDDINAGKSGHLSMGFSFPIRYRLSDKFEIEYLTNALYRVDKISKYRDDAGTKVVLSGYFSIIYKIY